MAAFEFGGRANLDSRDEHDERFGREAVEPTRALPELAGGHHQGTIKDECIIAFKVYDQFRAQDCLSEDEIGPARAAENKTIGDIVYCEGAVIEPPCNAASVTVERLKVKKVIIVDKEPNPFKNGFWDVDLKYVFEYRLTFREADGCLIGTIRANNIFNKKISMFGSISSDISICTDLFQNPGGESALIEAAPFILVEAKSVALSAELKYHRRKGPGDDGGAAPNRVAVTIGLFSIIKMFRIVDLNVQSKGFCIPPVRPHDVPLNACEFFERLDFPMDIFAPPQKKEFREGVSSNIPRSAAEKEKPCDCE